MSSKSMIRLFLYKKRLKSKSEFEWYLLPSLLVHSRKSLKWVMNTFEIKGFEKIIENFELVLDTP